jgi:hypothetical protein
VFVLWDAEDAGTDAQLVAAIEIARALCVRSRAASERQAIDFALIDKSINSIEKLVQNLDKIRGWAESILDRARIDGREIEDQVAVLRAAMTQVKQSLSDDQTTEAAEG